MQQDSVLTEAAEAVPATAGGCYHCGEPLGNETIRDNDHAFCCTGCHTVFRIIRDSGLDDFYAISEAPGFSASRQSPADFSWLDDPATQEKLLLFRQDGTARVLFQLPQIHCASCVWLLEKLYRLDPGITMSRVNFNRRELSVVFREQEISLRQLVELLDRIGYGPAIRLADIDSQG